MKGPYSIIIREGETARSSVKHNKREAIRVCRKLTRGSTAGTHGDVEDGDSTLVYQCEAYTTKAGSTKVRVLEL